MAILDNLSYYLSAFIVKHNRSASLLNNKNILPFLSLWFSFVSLFACLTYRVLVFLFFLYQDLRNLKHHIHPVGFDLKFVSFYYFSVFLIRLPLFTDYTFITLYVIFAEKMFFIVTVIQSLSNNQRVINAFSVGNAYTHSISY